MKIIFSPNFFYFRFSMLFGDEALWIVEREFSHSTSFGILEIILVAHLKLNLSMERLIHRWDSGKYCWNFPPIFLHFCIRKLNLSIGGYFRLLPLILGILDGFQWNRIYIIFYLRIQASVWKFDVVHFFLSNL